MQTYAPANDRKTEERDLLAGGSPRRPMIMIVEDHEFAREAVATLLASMGYDVLEAANGRDALAMLGKDTRSDLILLDLMMPVMTAGSS